MPDAAARLDKRAIFHQLGYRPHPGQLEVHDSRAPRRLLACGVRWGKTLCAAMEAITAALEPRPRGMGWVVAPTYDLADKVFREIVYVVATHLRHRVITMKESERRLLIRNVSGGTTEIRAKSADNPVSLLGEGLDFLIVDEAARLKPAIWEGHLSQRLIDRKGWALLISTPSGKGWYYDAFLRGKRREGGHASWNSPSWANPHLDAPLIESQRSVLPDRVFRQEYGAEFLEGAGQVFRYVRDSATGKWSKPIPNRSYVAGLDLAKVEDYTVLTIVDPSAKQVVHVDRFHRLDWRIQTRRIANALVRYGDAEVLVDTTGVGEPIYESLAAEGCNVVPYAFTAKSKDALINNLAILLERRELVLPRAASWPVGIDELEAFEYSVTEQGRVRTGSPSGAHDDCVISLALAVWPLRPRTESIVGVYSFGGSWR